MSASAPYATRLEDAELISWARARINADIRAIIELGLVAGIWQKGDHIRPAIDASTGVVMLADPASKSVYALAPSMRLIGEDADGNLVEHSC